MKIKNINNFIDIEKKISVPEISSNEIEIISLDDIWDGPLSGKCKYLLGEKYFFYFDDIEVSQLRKYLLINLTEEQEKQRGLINSKFVDFQNEKLSAEEYNKVISELGVFVNYSQIIGWFGVNEKYPETLFMKSYFKILESQIKQ